MVAVNKICLPVGGGCWPLETQGLGALETGNQSCCCWPLDWNSNDGKITKGRQRCG